MMIKLFPVLVITCMLSCNSETQNQDPQIELPEWSPGLNNVKIDYEGIERELDIQLPSGFDSDVAYPLVFFFHGLGGNKGFGHSVLGALVDREGFVGVYPQGHLNSWNAGSGGVPSTEDDVGFTLEILALVGQEITIDTTRIYSMGYSNGGAFSYTLALVTDKFAAIASLSASFFEGRTIPANVSLLSVMQIHGEDDIVVPYTGGKSFNLPIVFESAMFTVTSWAEHLGLFVDPAISYPEDSATKYIFSTPGNPHEAVLICLEGINHNLNIHSYVSSLRCYDDIWAFFLKHPKVN